jgi:hypothetical protein
VAELANMEIQSAIEALDQRSRCRDMRTRWKNAVSEKLFYQTLMRAFAGASLVFVLAALVLWFANATQAGAGVTFISGVVSGGLAVFFRSERSRAEDNEKTLFKEYNDTCPEEVRAAL